MINPSNVRNGSLKNFPVEMIQCIQEYMPLYEKALVAPLVSKIWHDACKTTHKNDLLDFVNDATKDLKIRKFINHQRQSLSYDFAEKNQFLKVMLRNDLITALMEKEFKTTVVHLGTWQYGNDVKYNLSSFEINWDPKNLNIDINEDCKWGQERCTIVLKSINRIFENVVCSGVAETAGFRYYYPGESGNLSHIVEGVLNYQLNSYINRKAEDNLRKCFHSSSEDLDLILIMYQQSVAKKQSFAFKINIKEMLINSVVNETEKLITQRIIAMENHEKTKNSSLSFV